MIDSLGNVYYYLNDHLGSAGVAFRELELYFAFWPHSWG